MVKRGPACKERTLSGGVTCGGAEDADESHCGNRELRGFGNADDINNGTQRAPSPLLRAPGSMTIRKRQLPCRRRGFAV